MLKTITLIALIAFFAVIARAEDGVSFDVTLTRGGSVVAHPRMIGYFDKPISVEVSNTYKFEALARAPDTRGVSNTTAKISLLNPASAPTLHEFSILANLAEGSTVEYAVPGTDALLKVVQSRVAIAK